MSHQGRSNFTLTSESGLWLTWDKCCDNCFLSQVLFKNNSFVFQMLSWCKFFFIWFKLKGVIDISCLQFFTHLQTIYWSCLDKKFHRSWLICLTKFSNVLWMVSRKSKYYQKVLYVIILYVICTKEECFF